MKVFVGRSQSLWVSSRGGKVRRLPFSLTSLLLSTLTTIVFASISLAIIAHTGFSPKVWVDLIRKSVSATELENQGERLNQIIAKLHQEKEEARRLNTRLSSKLQNLEGALGSVAGDVLTDNESVSQKKKNKQDSLYKPASFVGTRIGMDQRMTIRKVDRMIYQLKNLPVRFPVSNPMITSGFGGRHSPDGVGSSFHHGVDFSLRDSDKVFSTGNGIVKKVGFMHGYGRYIDIEHSRGVATRYAHLSKANVNEGQRVASGALIAFGGSSGTSTGKHLHYEVLINGRSRDPMLFLRLPKRLQYAMKSAQGSLG
jgi:murein DD-endopeptidase MepM/ murein hydrolase activator NlpD